MSLTSYPAAEQQITSTPGGKILTNIGVWSPYSQWIVFDTRSDAAGEVFDGTRIEKVNILTGEIKTLYTAPSGSYCGVATCNPVANEIIFIHSPENPTPDWSYGPTHRRGVIVAESKPGLAVNMDACDITPPFTPGALRGGSHVHVFSPDGKWISFTYQDHVLADAAARGIAAEADLRNVGVSIPCPVRVSKAHSRNHDGKYFSVLVTRTTDHPKPGSEEIKKAFEEGWIGTNGYIRPDGTRQKRALAFQGHVITADGNIISEVFRVDLPDDLTVPGDGPLAGTEACRPFVPKGVVQHRLTFTAGRKYPGLQGPRHWLRSSPDGSCIAFLMKDEAGVVQLWTVSTNGGKPVQITKNKWSIASAFSWSPDGRCIAHIMDNSVCLSDVSTCETIRLTPRAEDAVAPRPEACVFSPDGRRVCYVRQVPTEGKLCNQIFVVTLDK